MSGAAPWQVAERDQADAAIDAIDRAWPYNQALMNHDEVRAIVEDWIGQPWPVGKPVAQSYLIFGHGLFAEVMPDALWIASVAAKYARRDGDCDVCHAPKPLAGVAVVAYPINLMALVLCGDCAEELNPDSLLQFGVTNA